eukprot:g1641.t1
MSETKSTSEDPNTTPEKRKSEAKEKEAHDLDDEYARWTPQDVENEDAEDEDDLSSNHTNSVTATNIADASSDELPSSTAAPNLAHRPSILPVYNKPVSTAEATLISAGAGGVIWHARIYSRNYKVQEKDLQKDGELKPRRPLPHAWADDFFGSLVQTLDGRWIFSGVLNGWPMLRDLELLSVTAKVRVGPVAQVKRTWSAEQGHAHATRPTFPPIKGLKKCRVTLRMPPWSRHGWSKDSPGKVLWYPSCRKTGKQPPTILYGEKLLEEASHTDYATIVHMFAHRYAKAWERPKDRLTYHAACLLEWSHGQHMTVIELAWWNGLGGYGGKSNWYDDRDAPRTQFYAALPDEMKGPWRDEFNEVRFHDIPLKTKEEFSAYLNKYSGRKGRFLEPAIAASAPVQLSLPSQHHILRYLLNYQMWDDSYKEASRNCQTFAADLFAFLTNNTRTEPVHPINRVMYKAHVDQFIYKPPITSQHKTTVNVRDMKDTQDLPVIAHLTVVLKWGQGLKKMDVFGQSDPQCTLATSDKRQIWTSETKWDTCNPVWEERCTFALTSLKDKLLLEVFDMGHRSRPTMGNGSIELADLKPGEPQMKTVKLSTQGTINLQLVLSEKAIKS